MEARHGEGRDEDGAEVLVKRFKVEYEGCPDPCCRDKEGMVAFTVKDALGEFPDERLTKHLAEGLASALNERWKKISGK